MHSLTFRSSKIVYYGPHPCENCGAMIVRMGREFGGNAFNQPDGPIYPNTEWHIHVCDPKRIKPSPFVNAPLIRDAGAPSIPANIVLPADMPEGKLR
jgi:hypothetical protein